MIHHNIKNLILIAITTATILIAAVPVAGSATPLIISPNNPFVRHRRSLKKATKNSTEGINNNIYATSLVSSRSSRRANQRENKRSNRNKELTNEEEEDSPEYSYNDLGPIGKAIAGGTEIVFATAFEYMSGFLQGLFFGTVVGSPGFLFRPMEAGVRQNFKVEMTSRFTRMNTRSMKWAANFAGISAAFGGLSVAVKVLRNGEEDEWTQILSSAAAGAYFARKEGPQAMLKGALLYGGLIYVVSGNTGFGNKIKEVEYTEKPAVVRF
jgi:gas vesicle protein